MEQPRKNDTIFWIETANVKPNPNQPRKNFDEEQLNSLAESIRQYGILQPLLVSRRETEVPTGAVVDYEIISGERRWRAAQIAGLREVPVIVRKEPAEKVKLELALIENLQRENLNPIEKAVAFKKLTEEFGITQPEIGRKLGKSRVYVGNTIRLLKLPEEMKQAVAERKITEGHGRSLLMISHKPEQQKMLFDDIINKGYSTYETEKITRRIAYDRTRKKEGLPDETTRDLEMRLANILGIPVYISRKGEQGKILINFSSNNQLNAFFDFVINAKEKNIFEDEDLEAAKKMMAEPEPREQNFEIGQTEITEPPTEITKTEMEKEPDNAEPEEFLEVEELENSFPFPTEEKTQTDEPLAKSDDEHLETFTI